MALNFTGKNETEVELIEKGDYEVTISCDWAKTKTDTTYISCKFKIRDDVEQPFGGRSVFDPIYKQKGTDDYNKSKINGILSAIPNAKLNFEDYDELIQYLNGKNMIVTVDIEQPNDFHSNEKNVVKYLSYRFSDIVEKTEVGEDGWTPVEDGDLPF